MKQYPRFLTLALTILLVVALTACIGKAPESGNTDTPALSAGSDIAAEIHAKYAANEAYEYLPAIDPVERDHQFEYQLAFNPLDKGMEELSEIIGIYADANFTVKVSSKWDVDQKDHDNSDVAIGPGRTPALAIHNTIYTDDVPEDRLSDAAEDEYYLNYKGEYSDWGNLPRYYMVQWLDLTTGEKLEKPLVQVFELKTELSAPDAEFIVDEEGHASFRWAPVKDAESYVVVMTEFSDDNESSMYETVAVIGKVDGNKAEWHANSNNLFMVAENADEQSLTSGAAADDEEAADDENAAVDEEDSETTKINNYTKVFGVVAIGESGHSPIGKLFKDSAMASVLPAKIAYNTKRAGGDNSNTLPSVSLLPAQIPVVMCDGNIVYKTISYDYESADVIDETWIEYDEDEDGNMTNIRPVKVTILKVEYALPGTEFTGYYNVQDPPENWEEELQKIKERQESINRGSGTGNDIGFSDERRDEAGEDEDEAPQDVELTPSDVFATNALSEYLAVNMIAGVPAISLEEFPEAADTDFLLDAFYEAYYQNPLILGVDGLALNRRGELVVSYQETAESRAQKQAAIREKTAEITSEIIKDTMSPLEKEVTINNYLCDNADYDFAALENAEKNGYATVDETFNDSFTAYGILVNGVGVCASYAASFKLLAEAAGLEAIVTTGALEGSVPHAWNRVNIGGEWVSVDVTNNDNPLLFNALLNLPDDAAAAILVEDADYMLDKYLPAYVATTSDSEYYRVEKKYFDTADIAAKLAAGLKSGDSVTLRTDYFIDDYAFADIAYEVMESAGLSDLYGGYWLGVITLSKKG